MRSPVALARQHSEKNCATEFQPHGSALNKIGPVFSSVPPRRWATGPTTFVSSDLQWRYARVARNTAPDQARPQLSTTGWSWKQDVKLLWAHGKTPLRQTLLVIDASPTLRVHRQV